MLINSPWSLMIRSRAWGKMNQRVFREVTLKLFVAVNYGNNSLDTFTPFCYKLLGFSQNFSSCNFNVYIITAGDTKWKPRQ